MKLYEQMNERTGRDEFDSNARVVARILGSLAGNAIKAALFSAVFWGTYLLMVQ